MLESVVRQHRDRREALLSIVVPMHDEADALAPFFERLDRALVGLAAHIEVICIDDGSGDDTLAKLVERANKDRRLKVLSLARNFGKEAALTAGLDVVTGDMVVPIDADLQDPPELIADFVRLWELGYDVIYGLRCDRSSDRMLKRVTSGLFYRLFNMVSDLPIPANAGDFRLMDRKVIDAVRSLPERNRFMKGLFSWVGFSQIYVPYSRPARMAGQTSWGYAKLWRLALDAITSFSTAPLRVWTSLGLIAAVAAVIYAGFLITHTLFVRRDVPGYASLMVVMLLGFAAQMVAFGILGEYIGRLYNEAKGRPIYIVDRRFGFGD